MTFGLGGDIDNLRSTHAAIKELLNIRANEISDRPRVKTPTLVKAIRKALKDMFKEIESAQLRNPLLNYTPLINKLNDTLDHYRALINLRATINKRKAAGLEPEPDLPEDDSEEYDF